MRRASWIGKVTSSHIQRQKQSLKKTKQVYKSKISQARMKYKFLSENKYKEPSFSSVGIPLFSNEKIN